MPRRDALPVEVLREGPGLHGDVLAAGHAAEARAEHALGPRVVCPRFGSVTCGEHIAMEATPTRSTSTDSASRRGTSGSSSRARRRARAAPRCSTCSTPGTRTRSSTPCVRASPTASRPSGGRAERPEPAGAAGSPDSRRREEVEALWAQGDRELRRSLLEAALAQGGAAPVELLRLALSSGDTELAALARRALAQAESPGAADAIIDSLDLPMPASDRQVLIEALARLGVDSPRARSIAQARSGLALPAKVDVEGWSSALAAQSSYEAAAAEPQRTERLSRQDEILASNHGQAHVELAESLLALAEAEPDPQLARPLFLDAQRAASRAEALGAKGARSNSVLALAALSLGDTDEALRRLDDGVGSVAAVPGSRGAMEMLELFAQSRQAAIARAVRAGESWPPQWLADVDAAYSVLVQHPRGTDRQALMHYDFVNWFGADARAEQILEQSLTRFPGSFDLHDRLRARLCARAASTGWRPSTKRGCRRSPSSPVRRRRRWRSSSRWRATPRSSRPSSSGARARRRGPGGLRPRHPALRAQPGRRPRGPRPDRPLRRAGARGPRAPGLRARRGRARRRRAALVLRARAAGRRDPGRPQRVGRRHRAPAARPPA